MGVDNANKSIFLTHGPVVVPCDVCSSAGAHDASSAFHIFVVLQLLYILMPFSSAAS